MDRKENKFSKQKSKTIARNFLYGLVLAGIFSVLIAPLAFHPDTASAQYEAEAMAALGVLVNAPALQQQTRAETFAEKLREFARKAALKLKAAIKTAGAIAYKNSLSYFLNTLAYDTATWIASGGEGQQPLFHTESWGSYLTGLADGAAGTFLETIGEEGFGGINICDPGSLDLKISLGLAIADIQRPRQPRCTASEIVNNFGDIANDADFLNKVAPIFDTRQNDVGIALTFFGKYYEKTADEAIAGILGRQEGDGFKGVMEKISDKILTPGDVIRDNLKTTSEGVLGQYGIYTGEILADAVDTFAQTLAGKLFQRMFREGLASLGNSGTSGGKNLYNPDSGNTQNNAQAAQERFLTFFDAGIAMGGPYEILQTLVTCSEPDNPGPEDCVIDQRLRLAIEQERTVREAIDLGFLDGDAPFGFLEKDVQPHYKEGYPYRSLLIMRAHRIIPVGWEIAAQIANEFESDNLPYTINQLIAEFDKCGQDEEDASPFCGLVDQNWVLKAPESLCKAEGPGPIIADQRISAGKIMVNRLDYCADYQSCIDEDENGNCRFYGYCVEERSTWNLQAEQCEPFYNTCTTYQDNSGEIVSYLANTLDYNGCSADNAGCQWFCTQYNDVSDEWTCQVDGEKVLGSCTNAGGCNVSASCSVDLGETSCITIFPPPSPPISLTLSEACSEGSQYWNGSVCAIDPADASCTIPSGGTSCERSGCEILPDLLANGGFEIAADFSAPVKLAENWTTGSLTYFERVSGSTEKIHQGSNSIRFFSFGGSVLSGPPGSNIISSNSFNLPAGDYTFSAWIYNKLNLGEIEIEVNGVTSTSTLKNSWQQLTFNFTGGPGSRVRIKVTNESNQVNGIAWFDDFRITQSCVVNPIRLTMANTINIDQSKIHFDRDVESCDADASGCSAFIRTIPNSGTNILPNSSFEDWPDPFDSPKGWSISPGNFEISTSSPFDSKSILISSGPGGGLTSDPIIAMKPATTYRISTYVKSDIPFTPGTLLFEYVSGAGPITILTVEGTNNYEITTEWQRIVFDPISTDFAPNPQFAIFYPAGSVRLYIDAVQIEEVATDDPIVTNYKYYGSANIVHLRKPPAGLNCTGDFLTDPDECFNYALYCQPNEVGCESYQPVQGGIPIPGVVSNGDYCPAECVGYDTFKQSTTFFESVEALEFFIPNTARQCNASQVGCDEFTNLDEVALGGEGREYFTYLRQCELPDDAAANCQPFYTWQGSEDTGFQLRVHNLSTNGGVPIEAIPYTDENVNWPEAWCDDKTDDGFGRPNCCNASDDAFTNPFCKEYIDISGDFYYRIELNTIQCSENCHPFRKTLLGENPTTAENNCTGSNGDWDGTACIYRAIPDQGLSCSASASGCREYRGNTGGNIFTVFFDDFEDGDSVGWRFNPTISSEALSVSGHSLKSSREPVSGGPTENQRVVTLWGILDSSIAECSNILVSCSSADPVNCYDATLDRCVAADLSTPSEETCLVKVGERDCSLLNDLLSSEKEYIIKFWAKSSTVRISDVSVQLTSAPGQNLFIATRVTFNPEWNYYTFGPFNISDLSGLSRLRIMTPSFVFEEFFIDNIEIIEIQDYAYVVKNSWNTPVSCDTMLGCKQYEDSGNRIHNLKQFTNLCREEAVGCEILIDTHNSDSPFEEIFNVNNPISDVVVRQDELVYMVNQLQYRCSESFEGCSAFGLPAIGLDDNDNEFVQGYQTVNLINDPDNYNATLCMSEEVGCEEYKTNNGLAYFKNPSPYLCELRFVPSQGISQWFKFGSNSATGDCPVVLPPVGEVHPGFKRNCSEDDFVKIGDVFLENPGFENFPVANAVPPGWQEGAGWFRHDDGYPSVARSTDVPPGGGSYSLILTNGRALAESLNPARDLATDFISGMQAGGFYKISFWAKSDSNVSPSEEQWYVEVVSDWDPDLYCSGNTDANCNMGDFVPDDLFCSSNGWGNCVSDWNISLFGNNVQFFYLTSEWKFFQSEIFQVRDPAYDFKIDFNNFSNIDADPIYLDNIRLEEFINPGTTTCLPATYFAGTCPADQNSCNLFIDPSSNVAKNLLFNSDLSQDLDFNNVPDGWDNSGGNSLTQEVNLKSNIPYTISMIIDRNNIGSASGLEASISDCIDSNILPSYDRSLIEDALNPGRYLIPQSDYLNDDRSDLPTNRQYSGRFSVDRETACIFTITDTVGSITNIQNLVKEVQVKETVLNYALSSTVDKYSCNGQVDPNQGCVLFNDRSGVNYKLGEDDNTYLLFDSDVSGPGINSGAPVPNCSGSCDTNAVLKVRPDRECAEWLSCSTLVTETQPDGKQIERCLNLVACDELNEDGTCASTSNAEQQANRTYLTPGGVNQLKNLSGFATVGIRNLVTEITGYYPYHLMEQLGESAVVANGNFESNANGTTEPLGWTVLVGGEYLKWEDFKVNIGRDPSLFKEGTGYLNLNSIYRLDSDYIEVFGGTTYTISGWINTLDLFPSPESEASIMFREFTPNGVLVDFNLTDCNTSTLDCEHGGNNQFGPTRLQKWYALAQKAGLPWTFVTQTFKTAPQTGRIRIRLLNMPEEVGFLSDISGLSRFDDISIKPVLGVADNLFVNRSCRLYPASDAPSCNFISDENQIFAGWDGYCLTPDPDNPDSCLQWWPVDQIKGIQIDESLGYEGRAPLYYCMESDFSVNRVTMKSETKDVAEALGGYFPTKMPNCQKYSAATLGLLPNESQESINIGNLITGFMTFAHSAGGGAGCGAGTTSLKPMSEVPTTTGMVDDAGALFWLRNPNINTYNGNDMNFYLVGSQDQGGSRLWAGQDKTYCATLMHFWEEDGTDHIRGDLKEITFCAHDQGTWSKPDTFSFVGQFDYIDGIKDRFECNAVAQVVTPTGQNKAWQARISQGSSYAIEGTEIASNSDMPTFGSMVAPPSIFNPMTWDLYPNITGAQRITHDEPDFSLSSPYQARAGAVYGCNGEAFNVGSNTMWASDPAIFETCSIIGRCEDSGVTCMEWPFANRAEELIRPTGDCPVATEKCITTGRTSDIPAIEVGIDRLKRLFATSQNIWEWKDVTQGYQLTPRTDLNWGVPTDLCSNNIRPNPGLPGDYCGVAPTITNIKVNGRRQGPIKIFGKGNINLEFNVDVDENQLPLKSYRIDWGDNTGISYSGVNLRGRANVQHNFSLNHFYDYWQIRSQANEDPKNDIAFPIRCGTGPLGNFCDVDIAIQARDNWGWCAGSLDEAGLPSLFNPDRWGYYSGNNTYYMVDLGNLMNPVYTLNSNPGLCKTNPLDPNCDPGSLYSEGPRFDCDDLDARTRFNPSMGSQGAIRVFESR